VAASNAQICRLFIGTIELAPTILIYLPGEIQRLYLSSGLVTNYKAGFARAPFRANFDVVELGNVFEHRVGPVCHLFQINCKAAQQRSLASES